MSAIRACDFNRLKKQRRLLLLALKAVVYSVEAYSNSLPAETIKTAKRIIKKVEAES